MGMDLDSAEVRRRVDADRLLYEQGIIDIVSGFGHAEPAGSYLMRCMAGNRLEIYLRVDSVLEDDFFSLGGRLASHLSPLEMVFRNTRVSIGPDVPRGLQWRVSLGEPDSPAAWKITVTALERYEYEDCMGHTIQLHDRMSPAHRLHILSILSQPDTLAGITKSFSDTEVWHAVIDRGVTDLQGLCEIKGIQLPDE